MNAKKEYLLWLESDIIDDQTKRELRELDGKDDEINYRFGSYLNFGTAGLRGIMAAGTSMMNIYTVRHASQGFADYINSCSGGAERGIVISYDSRINSELFARESAAVMAANGIKTYIFDSIRPTPVLSFALRELGCIAGINITASHNPKEYNGYKAYWEDGAQLGPVQADAVSAAIFNTDILNGVKICGFDTAVSDGKITVIGKDIDEKYMAKVLEQRVDPVLLANDNSLKVVYTPLFGTGYKIVPEVLRRAGVKHLYTVDEEMIPNGNFPGITNPNPEFKEAFARSVKVAQEAESDLIIATDPDADRVGIFVRAGDEFRTLTGNQVGALMLDYIITAHKNNGTMPDDPYAIKSIVSTELATRICAANGVTLYNVLTGFKFIGEVIKQHEESGKGSYLLGFEESYGYLKGTYARDKDAVVATLIICEMAAYYAKRGMNLNDALLGLYERYGYFSESVINIKMQGMDASERMQALMSGLREKPLEDIGGCAVERIRDYGSGKIRDLRTGREESTGLPESNVLYYELEGGDAVVVRPSGTEPKVKLYFLISGDTSASADKKSAACRSFMQKLCGSDNA